MTIAGVNILAVLAATIVSFMAGGVWYGALSKAWMEASGMSAERIAASHQGRRIPTAFLIAFFGQLVMAVVLSTLIGPIWAGRVTLWTGMATGIVMWLGFVVKTLATNHAFQEQPFKLTAIDGGHWLLVLLLQGAVIGAFGG